LAKLKNEREFFKLQNTFMKEQDKIRKDEIMKEHRALEEYEREYRKKEKEEAMEKARRNDEMKK